jgi:hypothetical protein
MSSQDQNQNPIEFLADRNPTVVICMDAFRFANEAG